MTRFLSLALAFIISLTWTNAFAQTWPEVKPIRIVIGFGAGSSSDSFARLVGEQLSLALKQTVIVEPKPGASGQISAEFLAKSPPDGYTLSFDSNTIHSANPFLFKKLNYNPERDFTPIARIALFPYVVVVDPKLAVYSISDLLAYAKANPNKFSFSYSSATGKIAAAALVNAMKIDTVGVAYKSAPEAMTSVIGGQVTFSVVDFASSQTLIQSGRLRGIAVTTNSRTALAPELPTIAEVTGLRDFGVVAWTGFFGPSGLPQGITDRLATELLKIVNRKEMQEKILAMSAEPAPLNSTDFKAYVKSQLAVWERQVKMAGIVPE